MRRNFLLLFLSFLLSIFGAVGQAGDVANGKILCEKEINAILTEIGQPMLSADVWKFFLAWKGCGF